MDASCHIHDCPCVLQSRLCNVVSRFLRALGQESYSCSLHQCHSDWFGDRTRRRFFDASVDRAILLQIDLMPGPFKNAWWRSVLDTTLVGRTDRAVFCFRKGFSMLLRYVLQEFKEVPASQETLSVADAVHNSKGVLLGWKTWRLSTKTAARAAPRLRFSFTLNTCRSREGRPKIILGCTTLTIVGNILQVYFSKKGVWERCSLVTFVAWIRCIQFHNLLSWWQRPLVVQAILGQKVLQCHTSVGDKHN